jgi:hypothetical protein
LTTEPKHIGLAATSKLTYMDHSCCTINATTP